MNTKPTESPRGSPTDDTQVRVKGKANSAGDSSDTNSAGDSHVIGKTYTKQSGIEHSPKNSYVYVTLDDTQSNNDITPDCNYNTVSASGGTYYKYSI